MIFCCFTLDKMLQSAKLKIYENEYTLCFNSLNCRYLPTTTKHVISCKRIVIEGYLSRSILEAGTSGYLHRRPYTYIDNPQIRIL